MFYGNDLREPILCSVCGCIIGLIDEYGGHEIAGALPHENDDSLCTHCGNDTYSQCSVCKEWCYLEELENELCVTCSQNMVLPQLIKELIPHCNNVAFDWDIELMNWTTIQINSESFDILVYVHCKGQIAIEIYEEGLSEDLIISLYVPSSFIPNFKEYVL